MGGKGTDKGRGAVRLLLGAGLRETGFSSSSASSSAEPAGAKRDLAFDLLCTHESLTISDVINDKMNIYVSFHVLNCSG